MPTNHVETIYSSESRGIASTLTRIVRDAPRSHEIALRLFKRDLKARYRKSFLGFFWIVIPPILTASLWVFLKGQNVATFRETAIPYPAFVFTGAMLWQMFAESLQTPLRVVSANQKIIAKVNVPIESLLLAGLHDVLFKATIKIGILLCVLTVLGTNLTTGLVYFPIGVIAMILLGFGLGTWITPVGMLYNDVKSSIAVGLPILMYLTPVVYPTPDQGVISQIMKLNPMSYLISTSRNWATGQTPSEFLPFCIVSALALGVLILGLLVLVKSVSIIVEKIGS